MRSPSVLASLIAGVLCSALAQVMAKRDPFVEHETFAAPAALAFGNGFQIFQDAALEVIDLGKAARQQIGAGFLAADAAGAEHRDLLVFLRIQGARRKILELAKTPDAGIDRAC